MLAYSWWPSLDVVSAVAIASRRRDAAKSYGSFFICVPYMKMRGLLAFGVSQFGKKVRSHNW